MNHMEKKRNQNGGTDSDRKMRLENGKALKDTKYWSRYRRWYGGFVNYLVKRNETSEIHT